MAAWIKKTIYLLLAACLLLASACSGKKADEQQEQAPIVLPTQAPELKPKSGGELRMPMPSNAVINEPYLVTTEEMLGFYSLIYESLVTLDEKGNIEACIAEHWECSEAGNVWTFHIRNAKWHDTGESLTSADVVFSYEKILSYGGASYYSFNFTDVSGMRAIDDNTLEITMNQTGVAPLYALTFPIVRADFDMMPGARPIGTGPYKVDIISGNSIGLIVNENWWKQKPFIEKISYFERDSNTTALASYAAGQLNFVPTSSVSVGTYRSQRDTQVIDMMSQTAEILVINSANPDLRSIGVRKALAYAIDRSSIITNVYMNRAQASDVPVAPDSWLYESKSKIYDYNIDKAGELLSEAGWTDINGDGILDKEGSFDSTFSVNLLVCQGTESVRKSAADMIANQLSQVGIVVNVDTASYSLTDPENEFNTRLLSGDYDIALMGVNFPRNADLRALTATGGAINYGRFSDEALDRLSQNIMKASDETSYRSSASAFQLQYVEELPCIVLYFRLNSLVCTSFLQGNTNMREPNIFKNVEKWYMYTE